MTAISEQLVAKIGSVILIKCCLKMHFNCKTVVFDLMVLENKVCFYRSPIICNSFSSVEADALKYQIYKVLFFSV